MIKPYRLLLLVLLLPLLLAGCDAEDQMDALLSDLDDYTEKVQIVGTTFAPDYKKIFVDARQERDIGPYVLMDTTHVRIAVNYKRKTLFGSARIMQPTLEDIQQVGASEVDSLGLAILLLADLTLPQQQVDAQQAAIREMQNLFTSKNFYVSFISNDGVSEPAPLTDYVLTHDFVAAPDSHKLLYRSVLNELNNINDPDGLFARFRYRGLLVFSDGVVYDGNKPMDPDHYALQQQLVQKAKTMDEMTNIFFVDFSGNEDDSDNTNMLSAICKESGGASMQHFNWPDLKESMLHHFHINVADYRFVLLNPDRRVFRGAKGTLQLDFYDARRDTLIASASTPLTAGSILSPIIVNGEPTAKVILQGCLWVVFMLMLVYVVFQVVIPYISYRLFLRRYVITYTGPNMSFNDHSIGESCYYCKAPFQPGDEVVVKCQHVMHKSCWDENGQHCPEYGRHCKHGSHFYNRHNLTDPRNASFYLKWIVMAVVGATLAWVCFTAFGRLWGAFVMETAFRWWQSIGPDTPGYAEQFSHFSSHFRQLPSFGLLISFWTTFCLSLLTIHHRARYHAVLECLARAAIAGIGGYLAFVLACFVSLVLNVTSFSMLICWIPWPLAGCIIALCVTRRTRIAFSKWWIVVSLVLGFISMFLWNAIFIDSILDYRGTLLISHIVFSLGLALFIAKAAPRSERYFLRAEGAIKQMDIAIYKWFRTAPDAPVTIGRSVDCNLQLSWDIMGNIAPIQAEVRMRGTQPWLFAVEDGVMLADAPLSPGQGVRLYHGTQFRIGFTQFTYIEKDI